MSCGSNTWAMPLLNSQIQNFCFGHQYTGIHMDSDFENAKTTFSGFGYSSFVEFFMMEILAPTTDSESRGNTQI